MEIEEIAKELGWDMDLSNLRAFSRSAFPDFYGYTVAGTHTEIARLNMAAIQNKSSFRDSHPSTTTRLMTLSLTRSASAMMWFLTMLPALGLCWSWRGRRAKAGFPIESVKEPA